MTKNTKRKRDPSSFQEFKNKQKAHYQSLIEVDCPALRSKVKFNSDGYYHMIFRSSRKRRTVRAQCSRLALIPLIKPTLKEAKGIFRTRVMDQKMLNGQKIVTCYALVAKVGKDKIPVKVIVRKISNGALYFHSIMRMSKNKKHLC